MSWQRDRSNVHKCTQDVEEHASADPTGSSRSSAAALLASAASPLSEQRALL